MGKTDQISQEDRLKRLSRQAALITAIGAAMAVAVFAYGLFAVRDLERKRTSLVDERDTLEAVVVDLSSERVALDAAVAEKKVELSRLDEEVRKSLADIEMAKDRLKEYAVDTASPPEDAKLIDVLTGSQIDLITGLIRPRAGVEDLEPEEARKYDSSFRRWWLWIEVPPEQKQYIEKVTYLMNHPSFPDPLYDGAGADEDFRASYVGWGCLGRVTVTLTFRNETTREIDFDQCAALATRRRDPGQEVKAM
jgi:hypothetical protein